MAITRRSLLQRAAWVGATGLIVPGRWAGADESPRVFRAGAHAMDITPETFPIAMVGYLTNQVAKSAHDRLHARCLVFDDGKTRVAIVVIDSGAIPRSLLDEAKARISQSTGIPAERMLMSATHTHSAPAVVGIFQTEPDADYVSYLTRKIVEGVEQANRNLVPARVGWRFGLDPTQVYCRRWLMKPGKAGVNPFGGTRDDRAQMHPGYLNPHAIAPTGPVDAEVALLSVQALDGRPIALLANYGMHYAGFGIPGGTASADYFGRFADRFTTLIGAENLDPPFVAMLSNGTSAETHCYDYSRPRRELTIHTVAESVARAAKDTYDKIAYRDWVPLAMRERTLRLPLRLPDLDEVARAREFLATFQGKPLKDRPEIYARETLLLNEGPRDAELKLQALRIGELGIAAIPCEVYAETGLEIKRRGALRPTFTIELANGYNGYLTPPEQHKLGGYTAWRARSSCLEVQAEPKILAAVLGLLEEVSG